MREIIFKLCQRKPKIGDLEANSVTILKESQSQKITDLIVFSELFLTGYGPKDRLEEISYLKEIQNKVDKISENIKIPVLFGCPWFDEERGVLNNVAVYLGADQERKIFPKALLPSYDIFDEKRYFTPGGVEDNILEIKGYRWIISICEDIWGRGERILKNHGEVAPIEEWKKMKKIDGMINLSASPYSQIQLSERKRVLSEVSETLQIPIFYVNQWGFDGEVLFDGQSLIQNGKTTQSIAQAYGDEDIQVALKENEIQGLLPLSSRVTEPLELLFQSLVFGLREYFQYYCVKKAILGLSGGIDSALVLVLAVEALGADKVIAYGMPSVFSSPSSIEDAKLISKELEVDYQILSIKNLHQEVKETLEKREKIQKLTNENLQSRLRGLLLMAKSHEEGAFLLNCSNKSELAIGYGTLYGDLCGAISPIGDIYKTEVRSLYSYISNKKRILPMSILTKEPSAELSEGQKDIDILPPYEVLDRILKALIEEGRSSSSIEKEMGKDLEWVKKIERLYWSYEYKRQQVPPVLRVSSKAFGIGRRYPLMGVKSPKKK